MNKQRISVTILRVGIIAKNQNTEKIIQRILISSLKTRMPLFWLVCAIGTVGPVACMHYGEKSPEDTLKENAKPDSRLCDVESVYDGDTVWVVCDGQREKLRLYCIDAPEMRQKPWGKDSRNHLREIIGNRVSVEGIDTDRYGRTVARIWSGNTDLNGQMIRNGWAVVYPKYCPKTESGYRKYELEARNSALNVWRQDGDQSKPWRWRSKSQ